MSGSQVLQVVGPHMWHQRGRLSLASVLVLVQVGVLLLRPWPLALAVDHALDNGAAPWALPGLEGLGVLDRPQLLVVAAVATFGLSLLVAGLDLVLDRSAEGAAERIGFALRGRLFDHAMSRSLSWHDRMRSGELVSRLSTDVSRLLDAVVAMTTTLVPDLVMVLAVVLLLTQVDAALALVAVTVLPLLVLLAVDQRRRVRAAHVRARTSAGRLVGATTDLLRNVRAVQAFGGFDRAATTHARDNEALVRDELGAVVVESRWRPTGDLVLAFGTAQVLLIGGLHVLAGSLTLGALLAVTAYLRDLYSPVRSLARLSGVLAKASASASRIQEVLESTDAIADRPDARPAPLLLDRLTFEDVTFGYGTTDPCVRGLDLEIRRGETVCLWGPSGVGKSTLTYLMMRLYDVEAGRIAVDGVDVRDCTVRSLRDRFAYVPQDGWLFDATLAENLWFAAPDASPADVARAAREAGVEDFLADLPDGYETVLGESAARLSGGQRRRVALARALVRDAPVLLLDEPTASLDATSAAAVTRALRAAARTRTVVLVTHDPQLAAIADRVVDLGALPTPAWVRDVDPALRDREEVTL